MTFADLILCGVLLSKEGCTYKSYSFFKQPERIPHRYGNTDKQNADHYSKYNCILQPDTCNTI